MGPSNDIHVSNRVKSPTSPQGGGVSRNNDRRIKVSTFCRAMQIQSGVTSPRGGHRINFKRPTAASDTGQCGDCYN